MKGHCPLGEKCRQSHSFSDKKEVLNENCKLERTPLSLDDAISTTYISVDDSYGGDVVDRQQLDLFSLIDFAGEHKKGQWDFWEGDSILSSLSREMHQLDILDDQDDGDHSPWSLPR